MTRYAQATRSGEQKSTSEAGWTGFGKPSRLILSALKGGRYAGFHELAHGRG